MEGFPKFSNSAQKGEIGVALVARLFSQHFQWIFRRVHQEQDFGIDGYVEIVNDNNQVTGRSFAVQIKCGSSYFKKSKYAQYWYQGEKKHLNYLLNHPVPIVMILVNPKSEEFFWRVFDINDTEEYGGGWRMPIPESQKLTLDAKSSLKALVGEEQDFSDDIDWYWKLNSALGKDLAPLICIISRDEIESQDFSGATNFFARFLANSSLARKCQGILEFSISGYDADPRELYEVPEVRRYLQALEPMIKYWFFFLNSHPSSHSLRLLMACVCDIQVIGNPVIGNYGEINRDDKWAFFERNFAWFNIIADNLNLSSEENEKISNYIAKYFFNN
jgi:hypothetical protein